MFAYLLDTQKIKCSSICFCLCFYVTVRTVSLLDIYISRSLLLTVFFFFYLLLGEQLFSLFHNTDFSYRLFLIKPLVYEIQELYF